MGMSTHVVGFVPPDEEYKKKFAAWRACKAARVVPPDELLVLFDGNEPDDHGVSIDLQGAGCVTIFRRHNGDHSGFDVDTTKLPKGVKSVRFYNAW